MPDPHVTVLNENTRVPYVVGSTPQDTFVIPFTFYEPADIKVYNGDTIVPPANYTVTGNAGTVGGYEGGHVTLNTPVSNTRITIILEITIERTTDFPTSADFKIPSLNTQFDRIISIAQQLNERMSRALVLPVDEDQANLTLPPKSQRASLVLGFDGDGNIDVMSTDSQNVFLCQAYMNAAQGSASQAYNYQVAAQQAASGFKMKNSVRAATTSALPSCVYNNGSSGANATLTGSTNGALGSLDGVSSLSVNDRILIKDQSSQLQNGIYQINSLGSVTTPFILMRTSDMDNWSEIPAATVVVEEGTINSDKIFLCTSNSGGVMGTTAITFADISLSITPQDGSITTAKLADSSVSAIKIIDGIVSYQKLASSAIASLADIIAGTANKIINAANFKLGVRGVESMTWLGDFTASSSAAINITSKITSEYDEYVFVVQDFVPSSSGASIGMKTSSDNGSTWSGGATDYSTSGISTVSGSTTVFHNNGNASFVSFGGVGNAAGYSTSAIIKLLNPLNTSYNKKGTFQTFSETTLGELNCIQGAWRRTSTAQINAVQFTVSTGTISTGTVRVYGLRKS